MNIAFILFSIYILIDKNADGIETSSFRSILKENKLKDIENLLNSMLHDIEKISSSSDISLNRKKTKSFNMNLKHDLNDKAYFKDRDTSSETDVWDKWTKWSKCSVTCGKGRKIRWRHCLTQNCEAETELQEKACQMPECAPFGIKLG